MKLHIDVAEHGTAITVSEMRKLLARTLSKLKGENNVTFSFHCQVELKDRDILQPPVES
jgi:hypothetical protein